MKQSFIKRMSLLAVMLVMVFGAFAQTGEVIAVQESPTTVHLEWEFSVTDGLTGYKVCRKLTSETNWDLAEVIVSSLPAAQTQYMDYSWGTATSGVYHWAVVASYESASDAQVVSNTLDKDMITEVDVTVTLNSGEAATGTVVTFTNTSEPDLELEYEVTLGATGKYAWDEFRKGTYDISVVNEWFANVTETNVVIDDEESFAWQLVEKVDAPTNLYVTPTAYASWEGSVPGLKDVVVTIGNGTATSYDLPINNFWNFSYNQQIFDADEIGFDEGTIFSVAFQYTYGTSFSNPIKIYMANTTKNTFASTSDWVALSELTEVYAGTVTFTNTNEDYWVTIEFDTPFAYTGGNVVLATLDQTTGYPGMSRVFYKHNTSGNKSLISYRDNVGAIDPAAPISSSNAYVRAYRNNVQFGINTRTRMAEQYKVFLDGIFIDNTLDAFYQYNVANLTVGQTYLSEVLIEYTTGNSARTGYEFTYAGCAAYNTPTALTAAQPIGTKDAVLSWTNPTLTNVDYLRVYRNGELHKDKLSMDTPFATWTDPDLANGTYNYALTLVYDDGAETCLTAATTSVTVKSTGTIKGTVTYQLGGNVEGATVTVSNDDNTYTYTTIAAGTFTGTVEAGDYTVKCEKDGHITQSAPATVDEVGTTTINFSLYETPNPVPEVLAWELDGGEEVKVAWDGSTPPTPPGEYARIELAANDVWEEGIGYIMLLDADAEFSTDFGSAFGTSIPIDIFNKAEYTIPENATNLINTPCVVTGSVYIDIPAGTYDYAILLPDPGYATIWLGGTNGPDLPVANDFVFEANKKYTFTIARHGTGDGVTLAVEDFNFGKSIATNIVYPKPIVTNNSSEEEVVMGAISKSIENVKEVSAEEVAARIAATNAVQNSEPTRGLTGYEVYRAGCYGGQPELLATLPTTLETYTDSNWGNVDYGVYRWGVKAIYDLNASDIVYSNCIDKDMYVEVSVKVSLNTGESPEETKVIFTNSTEPGNVSVYEIELDETGEYLFEEFRRGVYSVSVSKFGYAPIEIAAEAIWEAKDFVWILEESIDPVLDLYVSPTGFATWTIAEPAVFDGFYESFDEGIPSTWTVEHSGTATDVKWKAVANQGGNTLNGTPFVIVDMDGDGGSGQTSDDKLISPVIDVSAAEELYLSFIQYYRHLSDICGNVDVYDGSNWVTVLNQTATAGTWTAPNAQEIDVTQYINENFQVRFHYQVGGWRWYWAVDDVTLSTTPAKSVQYYKVWLDGVFEADTYDKFYQHDVTNLVEEQEYTTEVAIMYSNGISEKVAYTWTYSACENYPGVTTLDGAVVENTNNVKLDWVLPGGTTPPGPGENMVRIELAANNVWGDGSGYIMLLDADANMYPEMPAGNFGGTMPAAFFNEFEYTIPEGATNTFASPSVVTGSAYIDIPAGTYDYVIVNPDGNNTWVAGAAGNANSKADNYVFEANKKYTFTMIYDDGLDNDGPNLTIEDFDFGKAIIKAPKAKISTSTFASLEHTANMQVNKTLNAAKLTNSTPQVLYSTIDLSLLTSTAEKAPVVSKDNRGDVLHDNNVPVGTSGLITVYWAASDVLVQIADDFDGTAGWSIEQVTTNGFCNNSTIPTVYGVCFYADDNGKPGEELYSNITCPGVEGSDLITITLPEAYVIPTDGKYWISIYGVRSTAQDFNTRFDIYTSTTAIGSKLHLRDHQNLFSTGNTNWQAVDPGLAAGVVSMTFALMGTVGTPPNPGIDEPILGVNIYRDGEMIAYNVQGNTYTDEDVAYGTHEYCVEVLYESLATSCSNQCVEVDVDYPCEAPAYLEGLPINDQSQAYVSWRFGAEPIEEWLHYDNGVNEDAIGGPASFIWAIKFTPDQLAHLDGTSLTKIMTFKYAGQADDELRIYQGTNAATLLHSQMLTGLTLETYNEVTLTTPVLLDVTKELWIGIATTNGVNWPAATSTYSGNPNGAQISQDNGASWANVNDLGVSGTWMLRGFVTNVSGGKMAIPMEKPKATISEGSFVAKGKGYMNEAPVMSTRANTSSSVTGFNVYRKLSTETNYALIATVPFVEDQAEYNYTDSPTSNGIYRYQVTATHEYEDGYECESAAAFTEDGAFDYVDVALNIGIKDNMVETNIYPNPANSYVTIEALNMNRITVLNMAGQKVYDVKLQSSNQERVDVSKFKSGVYVIHVTTETGTSIERISVVR